MSKKGIKSKDAKVDNINISFHYNRLLRPLNKTIFYCR
jgi:hypothetical protein